MQSCSDIMKHSPEIEHKQTKPRGARRLGSVVKSRKVVRDLGGPHAVLHILQEIAESFVP